MKKRNKENIKRAMKKKGNKTKKKKKENFGAGGEAIPAT